MQSILIRLFKFHVLQKPLLGKVVAIIQIKGIAINESISSNNEVDGLEVFIIFFYVFIFPSFKEFSIWNTAVSD